MTAIAPGRSEEQFDPTAWAAARTVVDGRTARPLLRPLEGYDSPAKFPLWLRAVDTLHAKTRAPLTVVGDAVLVAFIASMLGLEPALVGALTVVLVVWLCFDRRPARCTLETQGVLWSIPHALRPAAACAIAGITLSQFTAWTPGSVVAFGAAAAAALAGTRVATWLVLATARRRGLGARRTLVLGNGPSCDVVTSKLSQYPESGLRPVAVVQFEPGPGRVQSAAAFTLKDVARELGIDHIVLAPEGVAGETLVMNYVNAADGLDVDFSMLPPLTDLFLHPRMVTQVGGLPLLPLGRLAQPRTTLPGKRAFDIAVAFLATLALSPLLVAVAVSIKLEDGGPVFYRQRRVGRSGREFFMLKFRSMVVDAYRFQAELRQLNAADGLLFKLTDDPRVTRVGRFIRRTSIDELPNLWNVIRGEMSLVGPRPLAVEPRDFGPIENRRHTVRPGITGYWQISGGNGLTYDEMIKLDLTYIRNWSLVGDVRLLARTLPALVHRHGPW